MERAKLLHMATLIPRVLQFVSATCVAGIIGYFLSQSDASTWNLGRFIYTMLIAALSLLAVMATLLPFVDAFLQIPMDIVLSLLWWSVFGLLFNFTQYPCGWVFDFTNIAPSLDPQCVKFNASTACALVAAIFFMVSCLLNVLVERRIYRQENAKALKPHLQKEMRQTTVENSVPGKSV